MDYLVHHLLRSAAQQHPQREALVHGDARLSYQQADEQVRRLAAGLRALGLRRGDRVGVQLPGSASQALALLAISAAGCVFVPLHVQLLPGQVRHVAADCAMRGLITTQELLQALVQAEALAGLELAIVDDLAATDGAWPIPVVGLAALCAEPAADWAEGPGTELDLAALLYTSGSTGSPKGVMLSHGQLLAGTRSVSTYLQLSEHDRLLGALPLSFDAGLNQLLSALERGACYVALAFSFAREVVEALVREQVTGLAGIPTLWSLLLRTRSGFPERSYPHLRYVTNTGGHMQPSLLAALRAVLPAAQVFLMYGLTEAFRSTYLPPAEVDRRPTSIGKAIPGAEIYVLNPAGDPCGPGEVGELVHRGPTVAMGYWGRPELSAQVFRPNPFALPQVGAAERVVYSGDLVRSDEEGYLYFVGRRDGLIKSSGFRVSPSEVEEALLSIAAVQEAAVVGIPDPLQGQAIRAFVVPRPGEALAAETVLEACRGLLPPYQRPREVLTLASLPKTANGKVDYDRLRSWEQA